MVCFWRLSAPAAGRWIGRQLGPPMSLFVQRGKHAHEVHCLPATRQAHATARRVEEATKQVACRLHPQQGSPSSPRLGAGFVTPCRSPCLVAGLPGRESCS